MVADDGARSAAAAMAETERKTLSVFGKLPSMGTDDLMKEIVAAKWPKEVILDQTDFFFLTPSVGALGRDEDGTPFFYVNGTKVTVSKSKGNLDLRNWRPRVIEVAQPVDVRKLFEG